MSGLKKQIMGSESSNGDMRPDSAPPAQTRFPRETPTGLRGLGSEGDVDPWAGEIDEGWKPRVRQQSAPVGGSGMKLAVRNKVSVVEKVVEEEEGKRESGEGDMGDMDDGTWPGLEDWDDDNDVQDENGWGFDDD
jgi:hypothetical protein